MPSFAPSSPEGYQGVSSGAYDEVPLRVSRLRARSPRRERAKSPFLKAHVRSGSRSPQQSRDAQSHWRKSSSSSLVSSFSNGHPSAAPPTTDSSKERDLQSGLPPPLTKEEFEALPLAIQRKYFSTLERLRFAQPSGGVDGIFRHYCETSKRCSPRQDRGASDNYTGRRRRLSLQSSAQSSLDTDSLTFASNLREKIRRRQFTREEQVALARHLRASVILDAADEAVLKVRRRASTTLASDYGTIVTSPEPRSSMESLRFDCPDTASQGRPSPDVESKPTPVESLCDSFRWLEDDEDLDLRLFLDDYHANLRETLPQAPKERYHPSFRRHMSITKIPFGRSSVSSSRPGTKAASSPASPVHSPVIPPSNPPGARRRSRTLSLITAKHATAESRDSSPSIDPAAAHYQDPEARLKLRVYLASPQKFDEAIEFGFPSTEPLGASPVITKGSTSPPRSQSRQQLCPPEVPAKFETSFLADCDDDDSDEKLSYSEQVSSIDPESPKTPHSATEKSMIRPTRLPRVPSPDGYVQAPVNSREMTLRMTLTRPDLRATEDQIYGWKQRPTHVRKSNSTGGGRDEGFPPVLLTEGGFKDSVDRSFGGVDHWGPPPDQNVMKRIWNRVRRS